MKDTPTPKHTAEETRIDWLSRAVNNHLGSYAIKGILVRQDVFDLLIESRLEQKKVAALTAEVEKLKKYNVASGTAVALSHNEISKLKEERKQIVEDFDILVELKRKTEVELSKLKEERKWISVKSKRPEFGQDVFVCLSDETILMGRLQPKHPGSSVCVWSAYFQDGFNQMIHRDVTHWQSLPEVPSTP